MVSIVDGLPLFLGDLYIAKAVLAILQALSQPVHKSALLAQCNNNISPILINIQLWSIQSKYMSIIMHIFLTSTQTVSTISDKLKAVKHVTSHLYITSKRKK